MTNASRSRPGARGVPPASWTARALEVGGQPGEDHRLDAGLQRMALDVTYRGRVVLEVRGLRAMRRSSRRRQQRDAWAVVAWEAGVLLVVLLAMAAAVLA